MDNTAKIIVKDKFINKVVSLKVREDTTLERVLEILQERYNYQQDKSAIVIYFRNEPLPFEMTIGDLIYEKNYQENERVEIQPKAISSKVVKETKVESGTPGKDPNIVKMMAKGGREFDKAISEILIKTKILSQDIVESAFQTANLQNKPLITTLMEDSYLQEKDILTAISHYLEIPSVDLDNVAIAPEVLEVVLKNAAEYYRIMPIRFEGNKIVVAAVNPFDSQKLIDLKMVTGHDIEPLLSTEKSILAKIKTVYQKKLLEDEKKFASSTSSMKAAKSIKPEITPTQSTPKIDPTKAAAEANLARLETNIRSSAPKIESSTHKPTKVMIKNGERISEDKVAPEEFNLPTIWQDRDDNKLEMFEDSPSKKKIEKEQDLLPPTLPNPNAEVWGKDTIQSDHEGDIEDAKKEPSDILVNALPIDAVVPDAIPSFAVNEDDNEPVIPNLDDEPEIAANIKIQDIDPLPPLDIPQAEPFEENIPQAEPFEENIPQAEPFEENIPQAEPLENIAQAEPLEENIPQAEPLNLPSMDMTSDEKDEKNDDKIIDPESHIPITKEEQELERLMRDENAELPQITKRLSGEMFTNESKKDIFTSDLVQTQKFAVSKLPKNKISEEQEEDLDINNLPKTEQISKVDLPDALTDIPKEPEAILPNIDIPLTDLPIDKREVALETPEKKPEDILQESFAIGSEVRTPQGGSGAAVIPENITPSPEKPISTPEPISNKEPVEEKIEKPQIPASTTPVLPSLSLPGTTHPKPEPPPIAPIPIVSPPPTPMVIKPSKITREATVRYYSLMHPLQTYPLSTIFTPEKLTQIEEKAEGFRQVHGQAVAVEAAKPIIKVAAHVPGCLTVPNEILVDLTPQESSAKFWITPLAAGRIQEACIQIWYQEKCVQKIQLPMKVSEYKLAKFAAALGIIFPILTFFWDLFGDGFFATLLGKFPNIENWYDRISWFLAPIMQFVQQNGGMLYLTSLLGVLLLLLSLIFYFLSRNKYAKPISQKISL